MTLFIDSSAMLRRYVPDVDRNLVSEAMAADPLWCASELCFAETKMALHRLAGTRYQRDELWAAARQDWDAIHVVPVDGRCLSAAAEIGARFNIAVVDAIHLAAAGRLPQPLSFLTFERQQIPAATELGFEVLSPAGP